MLDHSEAFSESEPAFLVALPKLLVLMNFLQVLCPAKKHSSSHIFDLNLINASKSVEFGSVKAH